MEQNTISMYETVVDRYNKRHKVFSVRFKDMQIVTSFTEKYNPEFLSMYMFAPVMEDDEVVKDKMVTLIITMDSMMTFWKSLSVPWTIVRLENRLRNGWT